MIYDTSRRGFLKTLGALVGAGLAAPAFAAVREPFVTEGEAVGSIVWHLWDDQLIAPSGPMIVHEVLPWDGTGYPIILRQCCYREVCDLYRGWYDFEWSNLRRDVPQQFWALPGADRYPNVHAYVREQRFGESPEVMRRIMERNRFERGGNSRRFAEPFAQVRWNSAARHYEVVS